MECYVTSAWLHFIVSSQTGGEVSFVPSASVQDGLILRAWEAAHNGKNNSNLTKFHHKTLLRAFPSLITLYLTSPARGEEIH